MQRRVDRKLAVLLTCCLALGTMSCAGNAASAQTSKPRDLSPDEIPAVPASALRFTPPDESTIPNSPLGDMIRFGRDVFTDTQRYAKPYVRNGLNCVNCHLDAGRQSNSAPMWAAYVAYPAFRAKNQQVNSFAERLEGCFIFSMNGTMLPADSGVVIGLISYSYWLATGAPTGAQLAGRGFPAVEPPPLTPDTRRGSVVYVASCASCHGGDGAGSKAAGRYVFPPIWGGASYNAGAGMHRDHTAAAFIKANMPLGQGGTLTDQEAWDV
ncbi:MAG: c-type cytochrome, partial [Vicinamibacterales bacterium]